MNLRLVSKLLGIIAFLIGGTMAFSLPWASSSLGQRTYEVLTHDHFETSGFWSLIASILVSLVTGAVFWRYGNKSDGQLYRKEAMAVVGLSWVLATILGALPFYFSGTCRSPAVRLFERNEPPQIYGRPQKESLSSEQFDVVQTLLDAGASGLSAEELRQASKQEEAEQLLLNLLESKATWEKAIAVPQKSSTGRDLNYRVFAIRMSFVDALFESQSGFSTTGATVIADLEDPQLVPHCILFWRSSTHFLGGLGIIVLFVAILGQGSAGKALMRAEMPGPSKNGSHTRMQHTAWIFASIYCALNLIETVLLKLLGLTWFDAICHSFGTMATGGFSTYNASLGAFDSPMIEGVVLIFMILAGTNFTLLYFICLWKPKILLGDIEWRIYMTVIGFVTLLVMGFGIFYGDFAEPALSTENWMQHVGSSFRYGLFQVVSIITTTGFGTHDFDSWNSFGRGVLFLLMFVGGCAGSTGGGLKIIRHILFLKILQLEVEHSFHPNVVRPLRLGGQPVDDPELRHNILVYFGLILVLFVFSWMFLVTTEPDSTWGMSTENKLIDSATAIAATLNNIGPGLGTIGATQNYANFTGIAKLLFTWLMMIGRLEIFVILVLLVPSFWRNR